MSISPINTNAQTGLVPQTLLGYSSNGVSAIEINPTSITIAGDLNTATPIYVGISASTGLTTTLSTGLDVNCDFNMNSNSITNVDNISSTNGNSLTITGDGGILMNSTNTGMNFTASVDDIEFNCNGNSIYLNSNIDIGLTTTTGTITLNSNVGDIQLTAPSSTITALASADITLTSTAEDIALTAFTDILLNSSNIVMTAPQITWNTYPMGITFFNKWNGNFSYNTPNVWEIITPTNPITFPSQFLNGTWAIQISLNCRNVGSAPADKELAFYIDFLDSNSVAYTGFTYNQQNPFANYFQTSLYTNTAQNPLSITYTDYFDFTNIVNNLELRLNWYGQQNYSQEFNLSTTFTRMTLIS